MTSETYLENVFTIKSLVTNLNFCAIKLKIYMKNDHDALLENNLRITLIK